MLEVTPDTRFTLATLSLAAGVAALSLMGAAALLGGRFTYGRFERRPAACEVWIAGGVGVTPFISCSPIRTRYVSTT